MDVLETILIYVLVAAVLGGICFDYVLDYAFDKDVPYYYDAIGGVVTGCLVVPAAIVCYILESANIRPTTE
jgi:hypothetical protein